MISDSPINRAAAGLLGLLDIKAMGKTPANLANMVGGVVDLDPFYRAEGRRVLGGGNPAVNLIGQYTAGLAVPNSKLWLVESVGIRVSTLLNGMVLRTAPVILGITTTSQVWLGPNSQTFFATATRAEGGLMTSHTFAKPFVMMPGWQFGFEVTCAEALGAGVNISLFATVNEIDF